MSEPLKACPKCHKVDLHRRYCRYRWPHSENGADCNDHEHFHRYCRGCGYSWLEDSPLPEPPPTPPDAALVEAVKLLREAIGQKHRGKNLYSRIAALLARIDAKERT